MPTKNLLKKTDKDANLKSKNIIREIWGTLSKRRKKQLIASVIISIITGFSEMLLIVTLLKYLSLLTNPAEALKDNLFINLNSFFQIKTIKNTLLLSSLILFCVSLLTFTFRVGTQWINAKLSLFIGHDLSYEVFRRTINLPYKKHLNIDSSKLIATLSREIEVTLLVIEHLLNIFSSCIIIIFLITAMAFADWKTAFIAGGFFIICYKFISIKSNKRILANGKIMTFALRKQIKLIQESIGSIRNLILDNSHEIYINRYKETDYISKNALAQNHLIKTLPRSFFEAIIISGLALICSFITIFSVFDTYKVIPILAVLAVGSQKLIPAFQTIFSSWSSLGENLESVAAVIKLAKQPLHKTSKIGIVKPLRFSKNITFKDVEFGYLNNKTILKNINLCINKGEHIGIVGASGSGKSTFLDLLMGLIEPTNGSIFVDDQLINNKSKPKLLVRWRSLISHVPQNIFLFDSSFASNIALGFKNSEINKNNIKKAAEMAQISSFIESCSKGYEEFVGERGIKLSGGEKQRIGIARALYKSFLVLVLDEATSSLDFQTELNFINQINNLDNKITIISVTHRENSLLNCDRIFEVKDGFIKEKT